MERIAKLAVRINKEWIYKIVDVICDVFNMKHKQWIYWFDGTRGINKPHRAVKIKIIKYCPMEQPKTTIL